MDSVRIRIPSRKCLPLLVAVAVSSPGSPVYSQSSPPDTFAEEIYPLLQDNSAGTSCVECHDGTDGNDLVFSGNAREDFLMLRDGAYLNPTGSDTLLGRVTSSNIKKRMPKGKNRKAWSSDAVDRLRKFLAKVKSKPVAQNDGREPFPPALLEPYHGEPVRQRDNQFISFRQLQGKMSILFGYDDSENGLLAENVALFGGADFETRFNESRDPTSAFLSTLDKVTRAVSGRAYTQRSGVFMHRSPNATLAADGSSAEADEREIVRLYRALLYRAPTETEMRSARSMLTAISGEAEKMTRDDHALVFRLTATDPSTGMSTSEEINVPVSGRADDSNSSGEAETLTLSPVEEEDPRGEARFQYDCGDDTQPYARFPGRYRFGKDGFLEVSNAGTTKLVAAAAAHFVSDDKTVAVDSREAKGESAWRDFKSRSFRAYNVKGKSVDDKNEGKGEKFLRYSPGKVDAERKYDPSVFYEVRLFYPGKNGHEPKVPVRIVAEASSPLLRVRLPVKARAGDRVALDAGGSFTVQGSNLTFRWEQLNGPRVRFDPDRSRIEFTAPARDAKRQAWVALCRALVRHPDFLFTRPPSLWTTDDASAQRRLQLVKLALDLVGRPPTPEEAHRLDEGAAWEDLVDHYLDLAEFRDFYFHRIRLYLESQGTEMQDEPARIWSYVAFNNRPFQEILTAAYTVGPDFVKKKRPKNHGRSGVLTARGFIEGKPGLPHYNYAAQVSMLFLGYVYEVPPEIVEQREGSTALGTTDPNSVCYGCHKILTPLAHQRLRWTDDGKFRPRDDGGRVIDASDRGLVGEYPFRGHGMEAFAMQAVKTERFVRTMIDTHFQFYFGRGMRYREDERVFYKQLWDEMQSHQFRIRHLIRHMVNSNKYRSGGAT